MNLSILDKIVLILKYFVSSFLGIEMFLVALILFLFLILNIKKNRPLVKIIISIIFVAILLFISGGFHSYVKDSIRAFLKGLMTYYYFPSISFYYIIVLGVTVLLIYTILNDGMSKVKRIGNYIFFFIMYLFFLGFFSNVIYLQMELSLDKNVYNDPLSLAFVQLSNFVFLFWIGWTIFYYVYLYLRKKFD